MKTTLSALARALVRYLSELAASEGGELLSARRKWHLLEAERYAWLAAAQKLPERKATAPKAITRHRHPARRAHA